ncbi:hypothetical protein HOY34_12385 [Xinfangfangia sp. D13-10-4-6]|uniref:serine protease n=1 Tax=Pseudogemmobacter hezensis TaxID=2737662 RepID=UPI001553F742|nr:serine protease [Pseudogemmobacter hezensis]NPD15997.1 hypothetical protein [Pseudogemmobacter hezensis]
MRGGRPFAPATKGRRFAGLRLVTLALITLTMAAPRPAMADIAPDVLIAFGLRPPDRNYGRETAATQTDLLWVGHYSGPTDGVPNNEMRVSIRNFQEALGDRPTGELNDRQREILRNRAAATSKGQQIQTSTSNWTGIRMALPMGFLSQPTVDGEDFRNLVFSGRAAVQFDLRQIRTIGATNTADLAAFLVENARESDRNTKVISRGNAGGVSYLLIESSGTRDYIIIGADRGETRAIVIQIAADAQAALQPVVLTMLESLDLFAGAGVSDSELEARLYSGDYPGMEDRPAWYRTMRANGSGSLVSTEGHILTNHHVIGICTSLTVNGHPARLIGADVRTDLALIQSDHFANREPISFRSSMPQPGEKVIAMGYPVFSLTQAQNVTDGIISSPYGMEGDLLHMQVTAPIQPGNSGGPVLDAFGRQVAVVVAKPSQAARTSRSIENVAWVIRGEVAIEFLERYGIRFIRDRGSREPLTTAEVVSGHRQQALRIECH